MYNDIPSPDPLRLLVQPDNCVGSVVYPECTRFDIQITLKRVQSYYITSLRPVPHLNYISMPAASRDVKFFEVFASLP